MLVSQDQTIPLCRYLLLYCVAGLACYAALLFLPHDPYIRYQNLAGTIFGDTAWIYERIHYSDTPIDVAFIGSSRTGSAVVPGLMEDFFLETGIDANVVNFSLPSAGFDIRYTLAHELLESRDVDLLVLSVVEQFPRDGHQAFGELGTIDEVLSSPWLVNRSLPENVVHLPTRQIELFIKTAFAAELGYRVAPVEEEKYTPGSADIIEIDSVEVKTLTDDAIQALKRDSDYRRRTLTLPVLPDSLAWIEFGVTRTYIERIAQLTQESDTKLMFLYLPFYQGFAEPLEKGWLEQFGSVYSAEFMLEEPEFYSDVAHASTEGARAVSGWLASEIGVLLN